MSFKVALVYLSYIWAYIVLPVLSEAGNEGQDKNVLSHGDCAFWPGRNGNYWVDRIGRLFYDPHLGYD